MRELHLPWLELSIVCPLVAAAVCFLVRDRRLAQRVAMVASGLTVGFTVGEWLDFGTLGTFSAQDRGSLVRLIFGREFFVIDELSAPLLPMTAILFTLTILATMRSKAGRLSFGMTLVAMSIVLATLSSSLAPVLIVLLALSTIPPWLEIRGRGDCARMYVIYMSAHIATLAVGIVMLAFVDPSSWISDLAAFLLVVSSLIRAGVFPMHSWIIDLFERATFGTALLFVAPMTGAYVVMRLVLPVVPVWALHGVAILSLMTAVYAAGMAVVQIEARRFFAFLFLSHSSLVLTGLEIANPIGMTGALCIWLAAGLSLGGFAITLRSVESRIGRISLDRYHGLFNHMPYLGSLFLLTGLASIGFPGSLAFVGMELLVEGTVEVYPLVGTMVVLAAVLNGVAVLRAYFRIFTGTRHVATIPLSARPSERFAAVSLSLLVLGAGIWPGPAVWSRYHAADTLLNLRQVTGIDHGHDHGHGEREKHEQSALNDWLQIEESPDDP